MAFGFVWIVLPVVFLGGTKHAVMLNKIEEGVVYCARRRQDLKEAGFTPKQVSALTKPHGIRY